MEQNDKVAMQLAGFIGESIDLWHKDRDWLTRQDRTNEIIHTTNKKLIVLSVARGPKFWVVGKAVVCVMTHIIKEARKEIK